MDANHLSVLVGDFVTRLRQGSSQGQITVTPETDLLEDIGMDSLELTQLIYWLEDSTGVQLDLERIELRHFRNITSLTQFMNGAE
jgi:acyl carrier protein